MWKSKNTGIVKCLESVSILAYPWYVLGVAWDYDCIVSQVFPPPNYAHPFLKLKRGSGRLF